MTRQYTKCQHDGCTNTDVQDWTIEGYDPTPVFVFCTEHAIEFGFCPSCGNFIGGTEDTFLTEGTGLCIECFSAEKEAEARAFQSDYDDYDPYDEGQDMPWGFR